LAPSAPPGLTHGQLVSKDRIIYFQRFKFGLVVQNGNNDLGGKREKKIPDQPITFGEKCDGEEGIDTGENAGINDIPCKPEMSLYSPFKFFNLNFLLLSVQIFEVF
jgi:hypothetical protein